MSRVRNLCAVVAALVVAPVMSACPPVTPQVAPTGLPGVEPTCTAPYRSDSPFNTPIPAGVRYDPRSAQLVDLLTPPGGSPLTSDPTQYTMPVFVATAATPRQRVTYEGWYSEVSAGGTVLNTYRYGGDTSRQFVDDVPIPPEIQAGAGNDGNVVVLDVDGTEWNFNTFTRLANGDLIVNNIGRYDHTWSGVPPATSVNNGNPYFNNGAGVPLLAGLVRPCEIARGRIEHALSFAFPATGESFVYPARKSDGDLPDGQGIPEGTRLQLDPAIPDAEIRGWGCQGPCFTMAKALQRYGMYVLNGSGRPKVQLEDDLTADWQGVDQWTTRPIPLDRFLAVAPAAG